LHLAARSLLPIAEKQHTPPSWGGGLATPAQASVWNASLSPGAVQPPRALQDELQGQDMRRRLSFDNPADNGNCPGYCPDVAQPWLRNFPVHRIWEKQVVTAVGHLLICSTVRPAPAPALVPA
jgi:hypothetical protein